MKKRILLFDDDYESMQPFKHFLEGKAYEVVLTAEDVILDRLATERFDLLCVDFMIHPQSPGASTDQSASAETGESLTLVNNVRFEGTPWQTTGEEFLRRFRAGTFVGDTGQGTSPETPTIVISATANTHVKSKADRVFEKPFDVSEVLAAIQQLI